MQALLFIEREQKILKIKGFKTNTVASCKIKDECGAIMIKL
jgi:hypothetical protein